MQVLSRCIHVEPTSNSWMWIYWRDCHMHTLLKDGW